MHLQGVDVRALIERLKQSAVPAQKIVHEARAKEITDLRNQADPLLAHGDPLDLVREAMTGSCYGGDTNNPMITYLAMTSRLLQFRHGGMLVQPHWGRHLVL